MKNLLSRLFNAQIAKFLSVLAVGASASAAVAQPDLIVTEVTALDTALAGRETSVSWTVRNDGDAVASGTWVDQLLLSSDPSLGDDTFLVFSSAKRTLAPGETYTATATVTPPSGLNGTFYFAVIADQPGDIPESDEDNNGLVSTSATQILPPFADLVVSSITVPETGGTYQDVTVQWQVTNQGQVAATHSSSSSAWPYQLIYLSSDDVIGNEDDRLLDRNRYRLSGSNSLQPGATATFSRSVRLPEDWVGPLNFIVYTDTFEPGSTTNVRVFEGGGAGEENNVAIDDQPINVAGPDLRVENIVTRSLFEANQNFTFRWTVVNREPNDGEVVGTAFVGSGETSYDEVWLSRDDVFGNEDDHFVGQFRINSRQIGPGIGEERAVSGRAPSTAGTFYTFIRIDDAERLPLAGPRVFVKEPDFIADLVVTDIEVPDLVRVGESIDVTWTVQNRGNLTVEGSWLDTLLLSTDAVLGNDVSLDASFRRNGPLGPSESYTRTESIEVPPRAAGTFFFGVLTDPTDEVEEFVETNNFFTRGVPFETVGPDLEIASFDSPPLWALGTSETLTWSVNNIGTAEAIGSWQDSVYLSSDQTVSPDDLIVATVTRAGPLLEGEGYTEAAEIGLTLDNSVFPGTYHLILVTDADGHVAELEGTNNTSTPRAVEVTAPPVPDLVVAVAPVPSVASEDDEIEISWTVTNQGAVATTTLWNDTAAISVDGQLGGDLVSVTIEAPVGLGVGESYAQTASLALPGDTFGSFQVVVGTDTGGEIVELAGEGNNIATAPAPIAVSRPDLTVASVVLPSEFVIGSPATIGWTVENIGAGDAVRGRRDRVYLSADDSISTADLELGSVASADRLDAGGSDLSEIAVDFDLASPPASGAYFVIIVTDADSQQPESIESNNQRVAGPVDLVFPPRPNLVVDDVTGPTEIGAGGIAEVRWVVRNDGNSPATGIWTDQVAVSTDDAAGDDLALGSRPRMIDLGPGESYNATLSVRMPANANGARWFVVTADSASEIDELTGEFDNSRLAASATQVRSVDLIASAAVTPSTVTAGEPASITWTSTNDSLAALDGSAFWRDRVFLSADQVSGGDDIEVGSVVRVGPLAAGASVDVAASVRTPIDMVGNYFLVVRTDADDQVPEGTAGEANNILISSGPIEITQPALPDLVIGSISGPSTAISGQPISITWQGENAGGAAATGTWTDRVYLSTDPVFSANDTVLGSDFRVGPLEAGGTFAGDLDATLPQIVGQRWLIVRADPDDIVEEGAAEQNNTRVAAVPINIEAPQLPDLVSAITSSPSTADSGGSGVVGFRITNSSIIAASGTWTNAVFLSNDPTFSGDDELLRADTFSGGEIAGEGGTLDLEFAVVFPSTLQSRTVYLISVADNGDALDESNESNNASAAVPVELIAEPAPDLVATNIAAPSTAVFGTTFNVTVTGSNAGSEATAGGWTDQVFLSANDSLDGSDPLVGIGFNSDGAVDPAAGFSTEVEVTLPLEDSLPPGSYRFIVQTDSQSQIIESDETNNTFIGGTIDLTYPPLPDLTIASVAVTGDIVVGSPIETSVTVNNPGEAEAPAGSRVDIRIAEGPFPGGNAIGSAVLEEALSPGASTTLSIPAVLPDPGFTVAYIVAVADPNGVLLEADETNNFAASSEQTFARPDLVGESVSAPTTALAGTEISIGWTVRNDGAAIAQGSWADRVSLTLDPEGNNGRVVLSRVVNQPTPPTASYGQAANFRLSEDLQGDFYVVIDADSGNSLIEANEPGASNRVVSTEPITITRPTRPNLIVTDIETPASVISGQSGTVGWTVENIGSVDTDTIWLDRVYVSTDDVLGSDDILVAQAAAVMQLAPGQSYERMLDIPLTLVPDTYRIIVVTDATNVQREGVEGGEADNLRASVSHFTVAGYSATASASPENGLAGTPITVTGFATIDGTGEPAAGVPVVVKGRVRGFERTQPVMTEADGSYLATLRPGPTEAGLYTIDATMPTDDSFMVQDSLVLYGLQTNRVPFNVRVVPGREVRGTTVFRNLGDTPLTGFQIVAEGVPSGVSVETFFDGGSVLAPLEARTVEYRVLASEELAEPVSVVLRATTAQGPQAAATLFVTVGRETADLIASTNSLRDAMIRGERDYVEFDVQNIGGASTGPLDVQISQVPWLSLVSPDVIEPLAPGDDAAVTLQLAPAEDLELGVYAANPGVVVVDQTDNGTFEEINFAFEAVSDRRGVLDVLVTSEFSYFAEPPQFPQDAVVTVRSLDSSGVGRGARSPGNVTVTGVADENGNIIFENLPEGWYELEVRAPGHNSYRANQFVQGADETAIETFVPRQVIEYDWSVIPIDFVDEYLVTITTVFETNVPAPVITIDADPITDGVQPLIDLTTGFDAEGRKELELIVTNHGLITAENFQLLIGDHSRFDIIPLIDEFGDIPGQASFSLPVLIIDRFASGGGAGLLRVSTATTGGSGCEPVDVRGQHEADCGGRKTYQTPVPVRQPREDCEGAPGSPGYVGGVWTGTGRTAGSGAGFAGDGTSGGDDGPPPIPQNPPFRPGPNSPETPIIPPRKPTIPLQCDPCPDEDCAIDIGLGAANFFGPRLFGGQLGQAKNFLSATSVGGATQAASAYRNASQNGDPQGEAGRAAGNYAEGISAGLANDVIGDAIDRAGDAVGLGLRYGSWIGAAYSGYTAFCPALNSCILECFDIELPCSFVEAISGFFGRGALRRMESELDIDSPEAQFLAEQLQHLADVYAPIYLVLDNPSWFTDASSADISVAKTMAGITFSISSRSEGGSSIVQNEIDAIVAVGVGGDVTPATVMHVIDRWNRTLDYYAQSITEIQDVPAGMSTDFITASEGEAAFNRAVAAFEVLESSGLNDPFTAIEYAFELLINSLDDGQGICVEVTVELEQQIAITRSAFRASLGLSNPGGEGPIDSIGVALRILDEFGNDATDLFLIESAELEGISDVSGTGSLPEGASGRASWRIIPSDLAAPTEDTLYFVTGEFQYGVGGSVIVVPLAPAQITVQPNASLDLKYFVERDVFGDDPFTPEVEPSIPYNLGLLMTNNGAGLARDVRIQAAEPRIIENDRGLVIDFDLIGTQVGAEETSPSLNIELGDIDPLGGTQVARWLFTSTLQGEFVEFEAEFVSLNGFNTPEFSLIDGISIFEMERPVWAGRYAGDSTAEDDGLFDFLTNETPDLEDLPDRLHQSNGAVDPVTAIAGVDATINGFSADIDVTMGSGWTYIRVDDPFDGDFALDTVVRSDGRVLLPNFNACQTNFIERNGPNAGEPMRHIHIFDRGGSGRYTLNFSANNMAPSVLAWDTMATHGAIGPVGIPIDATGTTSEPRASGISELRLMFDEPIDTETFRPINVIVRGLNSSGEELDLSGITVTTELTGSGTTGFVRFSPALPDVARYCISLNNVRDEAGNILTENGQIILSALQGDANGDRRVNGADVTFVRAIREAVSGGLIDSSDPQHVRADITRDGRVNGADVSFTRASNRNDARAIADPCFLPDGLDPLRDGGSGGLALSGGTTVGVGVGSDADLADADSARELDPLERLAEEARDWRPVEAAFAAEGVTIRLDPRRFVVGGAADGVDPIAMLAEAGVDIAQMSMLGFENWMLVEVPAGTPTEPLQAMLDAAGVFTSPMLRDDAGEYLIPQPTLLVRFDEATPEDWRQQVLEAEFGAQVVATPVSDAMSYVLRIELPGYPGDAVMAAANRIAERRDITLAEPDFVIFSNRIAAGTVSSIEIELTEPMALEPPAEVAAAERVDVVILDDGLLLSPEMQAGRTVFGGINTMGEPETMADVFGQAVFGGIADATNQSTAISIRSMASLNSGGRAVTTTLAMAEALDVTLEYSPRVVVSSAATGYRSVLFDSLEAELAESGVTLIRPAAVMLGEAKLAPAAKGVLRIPLSAFEPATPDSEPGSTSPMDTATRIGQVAAMMLAADRFGDRPRPELAEATLRVLDTAEGREMLAADGPEMLVFEVERMADRLSIDLDGDGRITTSDAASFIQRFGNGDESLDLDGSGRVDQGDLLVFMRRFEAYRDN